MVSLSFQHAPHSGWQTRLLTDREYLCWGGFLSECFAWVAIPRRGEAPTPPKRVAPSYPKRYGGQLEGHPIKEGYKDRLGGNCRQLETVADAPPIRRTDMVAMQSGGLSPVELRKKMGL